MRGRQYEDRGYEVGCHRRDDNDSDMMKMTVTLMKMTVTLMKTMMMTTMPMEMPMMACPLTNFPECPFKSTYSRLFSARPLDTDTRLGLMTDCSIEHKEEQSSTHNPHSTHLRCTCKMKPTHKEYILGFTDYNLCKKTSRNLLHWMLHNNYSFQGKQRPTQRALHGACGSMVKRAIQYVSRPPSPIRACDVTYLECSN